jgi:hypothetical protein
MSEHIGKANIAGANPPMFMDVEVQRHSFLSSELHEGDRSASRPVRCIPGTQQTPQPVGTQLRILHWPAVSAAAESRY